MYVTKQDIKYILNRLRGAHEISKMKNANFSHIYVGEPFVYPTNEQEADAFVKKRIRLWMQSWIESPLEEAIASLESLLKTP